MREKCIDNICPPLRVMFLKIKTKFFSQKGRKSEGKRGCAEGCGNVVNPSGFPSFSHPVARGKRGGDFLFKAPEGPLFGSPFPPSRPQAGPAAADFLFCFFFLLEVLI